MGSEAAEVVEDGAVVTAGAFEGVGQYRQGGEVAPGVRTPGAG
jgi:hypothetical protein